MNKEIETTWLVIAVLFTMVGLVLTTLFAVPEANTKGMFAGGTIATIGLVSTILFAIGIAKWNTMWNVDKAKKVLLLVMPLCIPFLVIGYANTNYTLMSIGFVFFFGPAIVAAVCGLVKHISDRIWVYRMSRPLF